MFEGQHLRRLGIEEYTDNSYTKDRLLKTWATILLDEFRADWLVDVILNETATNDSGQPWSLRALHEAQGVDWQQTLIRFVDEMPGFLDRSVWDFKLQQISTDTLLQQVGRFIQDLLVVCVHTRSIYAESDQWEGIWQRVKETEGYRRFLNEPLTSILNQLGNTRLIDTDTGITKSVGFIALQIEALYQSWGMHFDDVPEGIYVHVD